MGGAGPKVRQAGPVYSLSQKTIEKFESRIWSPKGADLPAIEIGEKTLTEIGYFVD